MITDTKGLYYKVEGDVRWHLDNKAVDILSRRIPDYWKDKCPMCGNENNIMGCRCPTNHRTCPKCETTWHWDVDKLKAKLMVIIDGGI